MDQSIQKNRKFEFENRSTDQRSALTSLASMNLIHTSVTSPQNLSSFTVRRKILEALAMYLHTSTKLSSGDTSLSVNSSASFLAEVSVSST